MDRRTLLTRGVALTAVAVSLAGCTTDEDPEPTDTDGSGDGAGDGSGGDGAGSGGDGAGDGGGTGGDTATTTAEEMTETTTSADETTETTTEEPTETITETTTENGTGTPPSNVEVSVGADGARFDPETFDVQVGGTVTWVWEGSGHNVRPSSQPGDATWSGTEGGDGTTYNSGHTHEYTFEVAGEYEYYCAPHRSFGMTGSFTVVE